MVYRGKPSGACERCRGRRLKCDQGSPACTQCMRAGVDCPGYRDLFELGFRDQNDEVIRRSQRLSRKKRTTVIASTEASAEASAEASTVDSTTASTTTATVASHVENHVASNSSLPIDEGGDMSLSPLRMPTYPAQELAKSYIFSHYLTAGPRGGHMSYLLPLVSDTRNSAINAALNAVGMAALSNIRLSPQMMLKARREYTTALSQTNSALRDPVMAKRDDILGSVVLLGMFEVMTCSDESFIDRWMKHMEGAARLIEYRGEEQLTRPEGLELFTQLRAQINVSNLYYEKASSPMITKLTETAKQYRQSFDDQIVDHLGLVVYKLSDFYAALKNMEITEPREILRTAMTLDAELMSIFINVPPRWSYRVVKVPMFDGVPITKAVWGDKYHVYHDLAASKAWNNYRAARILIQELILETVKGLDVTGYDETAQQQQRNLSNQSLQVLHQLVEDICASVPFHLGAGIEEGAEFQTSTLEHGDQPDSSSFWNPFFGNISAFPSPWQNMPQHLSMEGISSSSSNSTPHFFPASTTSPRSGSVFMDYTSSPFEVSGAGGVTLIWSLLIAANTGFASYELRKWITDCLDKIGHSMGINQALAMAHILRRGMNSRAWLSPENKSPVFTA
ncbi:hypothetical protein N7495_002146 [Penicillium taxi]|uniref:uncharacterized protein n=1 Tax=Penicillium taxi TaxID=168475 RepID=UPI002545A92B|nr:uncharacterized protein N7495_002146 [Penicillium taxi]KAJ5901618.1 hypothetical protein N7495_002146 [Penicillium taxi]